MCKLCDRFPESVRCIVKELSNVSPGYLYKHDPALGIIYFGSFSVVISKTKSELWLNYDLKSPRYRSRLCVSIADPDSIDKLVEKAKSTMVTTNSEDVRSEYKTLYNSGDYIRITELECW